MFIFSLFSLESHIGGVRIAPESYYHQKYHSQRIYDFYGSDKLRRLVRFRFIPADGSPESGRLTEEQQKQAWLVFLNFYFTCHSKTFREIYIVLQIHSMEQIFPASWWSNADVKEYICLVMCITSFIEYQGAEVWTFANHNKES